MSSETEEDGSATSTPLVSVILPTRNRATILPRAIRSVLAQTHHVLELIVVDDASSDDTADVVAAFADPRVVYLRRERSQEEGHPENPRNEGIRRARGEYLAFLDDDDLFGSEFVARLLAELEARPELGLVYCDSVFHRQQGGRELATVNRSVDFDRALLERVNYVNTTELLVRTRCALAAGGWQAHIRRGSDRDFVLRVSERFGVAHVRAVLGHKLWGHERPCQPSRHYWDPAFVPEEDGTYEPGAELAATGGVLAHGGALRLNLGCGDDVRPGYLNLDRRPTCPDVVPVDLREGIPVADGAADEVLAQDVLEHFGRRELEARVLPEVLRVLQPGGRLRARLPDLERVIADWLAGRADDETTARRLHGRQDYPENTHLWSYTEASFAQLLQAAGFVDVRRTGSAQWNMELEARRLDPGTLRRLLVVMDEGIGNMVLLTPTLRALAELCPQAELHVLGRRPALDVIAGWELVARAIGPDEALEPRYDLLLATGWRHSVQERLRGVAFTHPPRLAPSLRVDLHEAEQHLALARGLGFTGPLPPPYCAAATGEVLSGPRPRVGLAPAAAHGPGWEKKRWPHYPALAERLLVEGCAVHAYGDRRDAERLALPSAVSDLRGALDLPRTAAVLRELDLLVANDCGLAHMAAALGTPTLVLFGPTSLVKNRPFGERVEVLGLELPCSPCQGTDRWRTCRAFECLAGLTVERVLERALALLAEHPPARA